MIPMTAEQIADADRRFNAGETVWCWCLHHEILIEPLTEPLSNRIAYINTQKDASERPRRLAELQVVRQPEKLPRALVEAELAHVEARLAYVEAWRAYAEAGLACLPALEALHREECPDSAWNGSTIFAEER